VIFTFITKIKIARDVQLFFNDNFRQSEVFLKFFFYSDLTSDNNATEAFKSTKSMLFVLTSSSMNRLQQAHLAN
jgi:hypothetical protein